MNLHILTPDGFQYPSQVTILLVAEWFNECRPITYEYFQTVRDLMLAGF